MMIPKISADIVNLRKRAIAEAVGLWSGEEAGVEYQKRFRRSQLKQLS